MWLALIAACAVVVTRRRPMERVSRTLRPGVDYYIATTRNDWDECYPGVPVVHTIVRDGAVFTVIKGRRD